MVRSGSSASIWLQWLRVLVARELVEAVGIPAREAALRLGVAPSAISQYLSGKRLGNVVPPGADPVQARNVSQRLARQLAKSPLEEGVLNPLLLRGAAELAGGSPGSGGADSSPPAGQPSPRTRAMVRQLRRRIASEQSAVADCMRLAQRARDEMTRALFRQIASDSLRHAEIAASLASFLDRGISETMVSGVSADDVRDLITREQEAERTTIREPTAPFGGVMRILWTSVAADERKHDILLKDLLAECVAAGPSALTHPDRRPRTPRRKAHA
ncbi:MAG: hypothetical protein L3J96_04290 [Thermoplasmata archaeon]|nr:hypothetical protein [Thermoplasmata archaeon]